MYPHEIETADASRAAPTVSFLWTCGNDFADAQQSLKRYLESICKLEVVPELIILNSDTMAAGELEQLMQIAGGFHVSAVLVQINKYASLGAGLMAGARHSRGDVIVILPTYVQCDPADIAKMLYEVNNNLDYVASWRIARVDGSTDRGRSKLFNWVSQVLSGLSLHDINSGLRVMRRRVLETVPLYGDLHVFLPVLAARQGFRVGEVQVRHLEERPGRNEGRVRVYLRRMLDLLTLFFLVRFTQKPLRFFGGIGAGLLLIGGCVMLGLGIDRILLGHGLAERPLLVLATLLIVLGIQTFSLGLLGELIIFVKAGGLRETVEEAIIEPSTESVPDDQPAIG